MVGYGSAIDINFTDIYKCDKSVSLEDPANFINNKLKEFDGKNVKVEITIKISSI